MIFCLKIQFIKFLFFLIEVLRPFVIHGLVNHLTLFKYLEIFLEEHVYQ